jgi:ribosomal protein S21
MRRVFVPVLVVVLAVVLVALSACRRGPKEYPQGSPEAVIQSLEAMVKDGEAQRLHELFYAEDEDMRLALRRFGRMAGRLAELAETIGKTFPEEVAELKKQTEAAAARGEATNILSRFTQSAMQNRRNRNQPRTNPGDAFNLAFRQLLSNPYASFEQASARLSAIPISDGFAGLMWDEKPILPPFGIMLREEAGKWYIVLPLDLPVVTKYRPRTPEQWLIAGYLMRAWENAAVDLRAKIEAGDLRNLDEVASEAGAMLLPPTMMIGIAYAKQFEDDGD